MTPCNVYSSTLLMRVRVCDSAVLATPTVALLALMAAAVLSFALGQRGTKFGRHELSLAGAERQRLGHF